jgi:MscS family membrane protein
MGTVEDIGLRSTRIRTFECTQVSVPNGVLSTMNVENLSMREKMPVSTKLALRYQTTREQLQLILAEIRRVLDAHEHIESETAWVRLTGLGESGLTLEMCAYVLTPAFADFAAVREELLLRIVKIVEDAGTGFALPSQTLYLARDAGVDMVKAAAAGK